MGSAHGIILMCDQRAEGRIEIAAFVANRELQQRATVAHQNHLHAADEGVELAASMRVAVVVNASESEEQWHHRAQFSEEFSQAGLMAIINGRQEPGANDFRLKIGDCRLIISRFALNLQSLSSNLQSYGNGKSFTRV